MQGRRSPSPPPAAPSDRAFGPYTLIDRIAAGGMAEVFRAHEPRSAGEPRTVVIKRMLPHIAEQPSARAMFEEEARLGGVVRHPNVIEVLDMGDVEGDPYLVLEYVPGVDLWRLSRFLSREDRNLGVSLAALVMRDLLAGLHAVHEARDQEGNALAIVHRDVSPSNVLLSTYGDVKLGDFGIARRLEESYQHGLGGRKGKLGYLAPEQIIGDHVDRRTDVFASGVITAELLMGGPLFTGSSELAILLAIRDAKIQPFLEIADSLPTGLSDVVVQALAQDRNNRISTAAELRERLAPFQQGEERQLRGRLGTLVREAMGPEEKDTGSPGRAADPEVASEGTIQAPCADGDEGREEERPTADLPPMEFHVETVTGSRYGPWSYARTVQEVSIGNLRPDDRLRVGDGRSRPLRHIAELAVHLPSSTLTPVTRETAEAPQPADLEIAMAGGELIGALGNAALRRETGLWLCEHGQVRKEIYVCLGTPEFVSSNLAEEMLGEYLVEQNVIDRSELDMALAVMPRFEGRLGDTLVALELVQPVELFQHLATQVRNKLLGLFLWAGGTARFYRGVPPPSRGFPLGIDPWRILDEGIERRLARGLEDKRAHRGANRSVVRRTFLTDARRERLPRNARHVLDMLDKPRPVSELVDSLATCTDPRRGLRSVLLLLHLGVAHWADPREPGPAP